MKTIDDFNFEGKKALIRVDFNVPLDGDFNVTQSFGRWRFRCFNESLRQTKRKGKS